MYNNPLFIHLYSCSDYVHILQEFNSHIAAVAPNIASALVIDMYATLLLWSYNYCSHFHCIHAHPTSCIQLIVMKQIHNVPVQFVDNLHSSLQSLRQ